MVDKQGASEVFARLCDVNSWAAASDERQVGDDDGPSAGDEELRFEPAREMSRRRPSLVYEREL